MVRSQTAANTVFHGKCRERQLQTAVHSAEPWRSNLLCKYITAQCRVFPFHGSVLHTACAADAEGLPVTIG